MKQQAVARGVISGSGTFTHECQTKLENFLGYGAHVLLTPSCTAALEMCALLLDLKEGDEVIMPSYTFVTTASAFTLRGATPVFVDVDPKRLDISVELVARAITTRTKAVVIVHYGGVACDLENLQKL